LALKVACSSTTRRSQRRIDAVDRVDLAGAGSVSIVSVVVPDAV